MKPESNHKPQLIEAPHSASLQSAFVAACQWLDSAMVAPLIGEDDVFEDKNKHDFIKSLDNLFRIRRNRVGERFTSSYRISTCTGCKEGMGRAVYHFEFYNGTQKVPYSDFAYLVMEEDSVVIDIFRCYSYDSACLIDVNVYDRDDELMGTEKMNFELFEDDFLNRRIDEDPEDEVNGDDYWTPQG